MSRLEWKTRGEFITIYPGDEVQHATSFNSGSLDDQSTSVKIKLRQDKLQKEYYYLDHLQTRTNLHNDAEVTNIVNRFWSVFEHHDMPDDNFGEHLMDVSISQRQFIELRLLVGKSTSLNAVFDMDTSYFKAVEDWRYLTNDGHLMNKLQLSRFLFEVADAWCTGINPESYAIFLKKLFGHCTTWKHRKACWRALHLVLPFWSYAGASSKEETAQIKLANTAKRIEKQQLGIFHRLADVDTDLSDAGSTTALRRRHMLLIRSFEGKPRGLAPHPEVQVERPSKLFQDLTHPYSHLELRNVIRLKWNRRRNMDGLRLSHNQSFSRGRVNHWMKAKYAEEALADDDKSLLPKHSRDESESELVVSSESESESEQSDSETDSDEEEGVEETVMDEESNRKSKESTPDPVETENVRS